MRASGMLGCDCKDFKGNIVPLVINSDVIVNVNNKTNTTKHKIWNRFSEIKAFFFNNYIGKRFWRKGPSRKGTVTVLRYEGMKVGRFI